MRMYPSIRATMNATAKMTPPMMASFEIRAWARPIT